MRLFSHLLSTHCFAFYVIFLYSLKTVTNSDSFLDKKTLKKFYYSYISKMETNV